jgi:hypothetical protein
MLPPLSCTIVELPDKWTIVSEANRRIFNLTKIEGRHEPHTLQAGTDVQPVALIKGRPHPRPEGRRDLPPCSVAVVGPWTHYGGLAPNVDPGPRQLSGPIERGR